MSLEVFQLTTVIRVLGEDVQLAEALAFPEISALGEGEEECQRLLQVKAKAILEDPQLSPILKLHRRRVKVAPEVRAAEIILDPPKRAPLWQQPVILSLPLVRWMEEESTHYAFVPALGLLVFASRPDLIEQRIQEHVRLLLMGRRQKVTLRELALISRSEELRTGYREVEASLPSPREIATRLHAAKEEDSILETMAEELPPYSRRSAKGTGETRHSDTGNGTNRAAYEMETELRNLAEALSGSPRRSILLIGPAGSGKTALVYELARRRNEFGFGHTPFWSTSGARLMTGPIGFGMWQERCQKLCREAAKTHSLLHLSNLAELLEVGKTQRGQPSVGSFLRPWLVRGEVVAIAESTPEQLSRIERQEPQLLAAFVQLTVPERSSEQTRAILQRVCEVEAGGQMTLICPAALDRLHQLHRRYAVYSANPGRAVRFLRNLLADRKLDSGFTEAEVTAAFSRETGLPALLLEDQTPLDLEQTRAWLTSRLLGQPEAIDRVVDILAIIKARLARPRKPLASLLFIGPTGTGKSELAKALAEFLFGDPARLVRFDMNQYNDPAALHRLMGSPALGSPEGLLTARVREQPFSVLLLDEFEKADAGFFDLLLQILGDGRLTDGAGRVADFCNCVIIMTSNLGAQGFQRGPAGFQTEGQASNGLQQHFIDAVRKFLRPEIYNRLDAVVPFIPLSPDVVMRIAQRQMELVRRRDGIRLRPVELTFQPGLAEFLAQRGYDIRYGARPLKRAVERELLIPMAEALSNYAEELPLTVKASVVQGRIGIAIKPRLAEKGAAAGSSLVEASQQELAMAVTRQRRLINRLQRCSATSELENQATMYESLERRLAAASWKSREQQAQLDRLSVLRDCLRAITALHGRACQTETDTLCRIYQGSSLPRPRLTAELADLEKENRQLMRQVFRLRQPDPDDIVLAIFSEDRATMIELASTYGDLARAMGQIVAMDLFRPLTGIRSKARKIVREPVKQPGLPWSDLPDKLLGIAMHLRGDLFYPRFQGEAGLHVIRVKNAEHASWVVARPAPLKDYQPPAGINRAGTISSKGIPQRRFFRKEEDLVEDSVLGQRPWRDRAIKPCLKVLMEERLDQLIDAMIQS